MNKPNHFFSHTALISLLIGLLISYPVPAAAEVAAEQLTPVRGVIVEQMRFADEIEAVGTAYANEAIEVTSLVTEKIQSIEFDEGQPVKAGALLVILNNQAEKAQLMRAQADLREQERELKRISELVRRGAVSSSQLDEQQTMLEISRANLLAAQAALADRTIDAPFDGVTGVRNVSVGSLVEPGDIITTLDDITTVKADFLIPALYSSVLSVGQAAVLTMDAYPDDAFKGVVSVINPRADVDSRAVLVRVKVDNQARRVKPGMMMRLVLSGQPRQAILLPEIAVIQERDKHYVMVVDEAGTVLKQLVKIGSRVRGRVEIKEGLTAGQRVVTHGLMRIFPGAKVNFETDASSGSAL